MRAEGWVVADRLEVGVGFKSHNIGVASGLGLLEAVDRALGVVLMRARAAWADGAGEAADVAGGP